MNYQHEENILKKLISEYEGMSQKGTVRFFEKAVLLDIIIFYENKEEYGSAIEVCDYAWKLHVASTEFLYHKGRLLATLGELSASLECVAEGLSFSPENFELKLLRADIWIKFGEFTIAYETLKEIYQQSSQNEQKAETLLYLAKIQEINGDYEKMFFTLRKALLKDPHHPLLLSKIWIAAELSELYQESVDFHSELIEEHPYSFLAWYNLGQAYFCLEKFEDAAEAFEYTFIINPHFEIAYTDGAESYIMAEQYDNALKIYEELLEVIEPSSDAFAKIGFCYEHLGEVETAQAFYKKAIQLNPSNSMALFRLGECCMFQESWDEAIDYYNQAIEADCNQEEYLIAIAEAYFKNKNTQQARIFFQKATEMAPELSKYWTQYAAFLMKMGDSEEAFSILDEAQIYTVDTEVLYCKAACLFAMSKRKEALQTLTQALEENASLLESLFALTPELEEDSEVRALIKAFKR